MEKETVGVFEKERERETVCVVVWALDRESERETEKL